MPQSLNSQNDKATWMEHFFFLNLEYINFAVCFSGALRVKKNQSLL